MLVKFVSRTPGEHREIRTVVMDAVPREGDPVSIDGVSRRVHAVSWDIGEAGETDYTAIVLLRE